MAFGTVSTDVIQTSDGLTLGAGNATLIKNKLINGSMTVDQRNAGASVSTAAGGSVYTLDRWLAVYSANSKFTIQQNAGSVTAPAGFPNYLGITSSSAYSVGSTDYFAISQRIEGFNTADLAWGTASAKTVTLSFQVYSSLTGTFGGSIVNSAGTRSYPFTYTISSANTWTSISVTIAGDTSGTWVGATNGVGMIVYLGIGVGSTFSGTAGSWSANNYFSATGATSVVGTNGATFYITGCQLERGSSATGFEYVNYQTSLANCQRYFYTLGGSFNGSVSFQQYSSGGYASSSTNAYFAIPLPVTMRTSPTYSYTGLANFTIQYGGGTAPAPSASTLDIGSPTSAGIQFAVTGMTSGQVLRLFQNSFNSTSLQFSAEL